MIKWFTIRDIVKKSILHDQMIYDSRYIQKEFLHYQIIYDSRDIFKKSVLHYQMIYDSIYIQKNVFFFVCWYSSVTIFKVDEIWKFECLNNGAWLFHQIKKFLNCALKTTVTELKSFLAEVPFKDLNPQGTVLCDPKVFIHKGSFLFQV